MTENNPLSLKQVAAAIAHVNRLDVKARVARCDEVFAQQPAVLGAVVQLHSLGVDFATQEHAYYVLLVLYECFTRCVPGLPRITEEMVQAAFDNNAAMLRFYDKETQEEAARLKQLAVARHPERNVLAFVYGYLADHFPKFSRENELVINACTAIMNAFVKGKQLAESRDVGSKANQLRERKRRRRSRRGH